MGAKVGDPSRQVVAVCGDGGFQMCMMELGTMRQYKVPVKIAVIRNNVLGLVRQFQHFNYKDRFSVIDLTGSPERKPSKRSWKKMNLYCSSVM